MLWNHGRRFILELDIIMTIAAFRVGFSCRSAIRRPIARAVKDPATLRPVDNPQIIAPQHDHGAPCHFGRGLGAFKFQVLAQPGGRHSDSERVTNLNLNLNSRAGRQASEGGDSDSERRRRGEGRGSQRRGERGDEQIQQGRARGGAHVARDLAF